MQLFANNNISTRECISSAAKKKKKKTIISVSILVPLHWFPSVYILKRTKTPEGVDGYIMPRGGLLLLLSTVTCDYNTLHRDVDREREYKKNFAWREFQRLKHRHLVILLLRNMH